MSNLSKLAKVIVVVLDLATAASAVKSAQYWSKASVLHIPPPGTCFDGCGPTDPFVVKLQESSGLNAIAARYASWSALLLGAGVVVRLGVGALDRRRSG